MFIELSTLLCMHFCIKKKKKIAGILTYRPVGKSFLADLFSESGNNNMLLWREYLLLLENVKAFICKLHNPVYNLNVAIL